MSSTERRIEMPLTGALFVYILLCSAIVTYHGALVEMDVSDLWREADVVLIGDVLNITTHQGDRGTIYRRVLVEVERYHKNPLNTSQVDIHVLGGVIGNISCWVEDQPELEVGETVLVFLAHHPEEHPLYKAEGYDVVGELQGKFTVAEGVAKNARVTLKLTDSLGLPAIFIASELCVYQWGERAENINVTFKVTNVGEAAGCFNASFSYQDPALEGAGAGGYGIADVFLEAGESFTVSHAFIPELPGTYEVEADTEQYRKDYRNPLTMNFEVLEPKPGEPVAISSWVQAVIVLWLIVLIIVVVLLYMKRGAD